MKNNANALISLEDVSEELVIEYLCAHPEFFQKHEDLLENLLIPHTCGNAVSLIERQVVILRDKNRKLSQEMLETLSIAKENEQLFDATRRLTLSLLNTANCNEMLQKLESSIRYDFKADFFRIGLIEIPKKATSKAIFKFDSKVNSDIHKLLQANKAVCKSLTKAQNKFLFRNHASQVGSSALLPIGIQGRHGVLVIGSKKKSHFHKDMDTLFLDYIAKVLGQLIPRYSKDS